jgi:hypothetical protein
MPARGVHSADLHFAHHWAVRKTIYPVGIYLALFPLLHDEIQVHPMPAKLERAFYLQLFLSLN